LNVSYQGNGDDHARIVVKGDIFQDITGTPVQLHPDYVFSNNYHLMSIDSLRQYIEFNKHLPSMPSAKDVRKNGAGVFLLNSIMLEKLEEAYLYIFMLEERLANLEKEKNVQN